MGDLKKIFKRDRFYWGVMMVVMTLLVIYLLTNVYGSYHKLFHLEDYTERAEYLRELWNTHPDLFDPGRACMDEIPYVSLEPMVLMTVIAAFIAQAVRLLVQETQNRTEVLRIFPVKSRNILTCHYLSGLLMVGIPLLAQAAIIWLNIRYVEKNTDFIFSNKEQLWLYVGKAVIIFMLYYSLLIVCRKVTNHVPGTIFTFIVVKMAMEVLAGYCLGIYENLADDNLFHWAFWAIETIVLILFSYIADQKKDDARNGFYAFPVVHWGMMGIVFGEIYFIFHDVYGDAPKVVSVFSAIAASVLITTGVHFIARPKNV